MPRQRKDVKIDIETIELMLRAFGIRHYSRAILKQLSGFNLRCISVILEEARLSARKSKRRRIIIKDLNMAILKVQNGIITVISPPEVPEKKDILVEPDFEITNDELYNIIDKQFDRQPDDALPDEDVLPDTEALPDKDVLPAEDVLPDLGYFDIEEFIRSIQVNQDTVEKKFDVESLLNNPYSL